jgi:hypothetical protein
MNRKTTKLVTNEQQGGYVDGKYSLIRITIIDHDPVNFYLSFSLLIRLYLNG